MNTEIQFHPFAAIFPLLEGTELEALADDIRQHGLREDVWLYEGMVLDGRNRKTACLMAGVEPRFRTFTGSRREAVEFVWSMNFARRHLNSGQVAIAQAKRQKFDAEFAAEVEKMKAAQPKGGRPKKDEKPPLLITEVSSPTERETSVTIAKAAGTNRRYLEAARDLLDSDPEKLIPVEEGKKTLSQVIREVKREETQAKLAELPGDKYRVIYADPPWNYGNSGTGIDNYGPAERHYPAMAIAELCALDIKSIAEQNAVLFLWVTSPLLGECWPVIKAWGFEYKTSFVWDKVKHNYGHYNSVRHELLLICTRGSCTPDAKKLFDSVVTVERTGKHSEKPEEFRDIINTLYTSGKKIELFARNATDGWDTYGNEL